MHGNFKAHQGHKREQRNYHGKGVKTCGGKKRVPSKKHTYFENNTNNCARYARKRGIEFFVGGNGLNIGRARKNEHKAGQKGGKGGEQPARYARHKRREVSRLIAAMGGNGFSAYGLCHLGDYEATVFSQYSHNRRFGEMFVRGEPYTELAEGYDTVKALCALADRYHVDLPIGRAVYAVLYDGAQPKEQMNQLFTRSLKREFDI